jgi:hypothetical protein
LEKGNCSASPPPPGGKIVYRARFCPRRVLTSKYFPGPWRLIANIKLGRELRENSEEKHNEHQAYQEHQEKHKSAGNEVSCCTACGLASVVVRGEEKKQMLSRKRNTKN